MHSALKTLGDLISLASVNPMGQAIDSGIHLEHRVMLNGNRTIVFK